MCGLVTKIYTQRPLTATRRRGLLFLHIKQVPIKGHQDKEQKQGEKKQTKKKQMGTFTLMTALLPLKYSYVHESLNDQ